MQYFCVIETIEIVFRYTADNLYMYFREKTIVGEFIVAIRIIPTTNPLIHPKDVPFRPFN